MQLKAQSSHALEDFGVHGENTRKTLVKYAQGFASGDLERDAAAIRLFADAGLELLLAQVIPAGNSRCHRCPREPQVSADAANVARAPIVAASQCCRGYVPSHYSEQPEQ